MFRLVCVVCLAMAASVARADEVRWGGGLAVAAMPGQDEPSLMGLYADLAVPVGPIAVVTDVRALYGDDARDAPLFCLDCDDGPTPATQSLFWLPVSLGVRGHLGRGADVSTVLGGGMAASFLGTDHEALGDGGRPYGHLGAHAPYAWAEAGIEWAQAALSLRVDVPLRSAGTDDAPTFVPVSLNFGFRR
jgi:hypothetical protein